MIGRTGVARSTSTRYEATIGTRRFVVEVIEGAAGLAVRIDGGPAKPVVVRRPKGDDLHVFLLDGQSFAAAVAGREGTFGVVVEGVALEVELQDERAARLARAAAATSQLHRGASVQAPMPGLVVAVHVRPGDAVTKGTSLVVLQAMKMENELTAPTDGTVKDVVVSPGQAVDQGQTLVTLE